jgi:S1-C subfamily serine protease
MRAVIPLLLAAVLIQTDLKTAEIARRAGPAVVTIRTTTASGLVNGSGFILDPSGTIVTNLHVIEGGTAVAVKLTNGDVYDQIRVRAFDVRKDLAVIQLSAFGLPTVEFGDSDSVQPGQPVLLIGNPSGKGLGALEGSVTTGVVSGVRTLESEGFRVIQTDAAANPGNSGGPLLDSSGKVIGVLTFKLLGENVNFVIPANYARGLLASTESYSLGELAVRLAGASPDLFSVTRGVLPSRWKSIVSGASKVVKADAEHLYIETVLTEAERRAGDFNIAELKKSGATFQGVTRSRFTCGYLATDVWPRYTKYQAPNVCGNELQTEITLLTPTRIEGWLMSYPPKSKFDCKKCQWSGKPVKTPFVWIPE